jgi:ribosome-binding ATPase YchF (GTP1/OBG family)
LKYTIVFHYGMHIGIVGKPNCGKSTFFRAMTDSDVESANYPFATIDPNEGVGYVRVDCAAPDFDETCDPRTGRCVDGDRFVPVNLMDVAGLVPDAHEGKGMGLEFLDDLNRADALIHVIDASGGTNAEGEPVENGSYDPANDIEFLEDELDQWYLQTLQDGWEKLVRKVSQTDLERDEELSERMSGLGASEADVKSALLDAGLAETELGAWSASDKLRFWSSLRRLTKPMVIAANKADVPGAMDTVERLQEDYPEYAIVPMSAQCELVLRDAAAQDVVSYLPGSDSFSVERDVSDEQRDGLDFVASVLDDIGSTGAQRVLDTAVFDVLDMVYAFPGSDKLEDKDGNTLPDCFLLPRGSTVLDFAYHIHSDIGDNFVQAYDVRRGINVGKDYELSDGDVIEIVADD